MDGARVATFLPLAYLVDAADDAERYAAKLRRLYVEQAMIGAVPEELPVDVAP